MKFRENPLSLAASEKDGRDSPVTWLVAVVVMGLLAFMVVMRAGCTQQAKDKQIKRMAIEDCWKDYERKSLDPRSKRFVASVCEKIEADFKASYGVAP